MTPKEKAKELICKFEILESPCFNGNTVELEQIGYNTAKKIALTAVDEIIDILELNGFTLQEYHDKGTLEYWLHVKEEIEKL